VRPGRLETTILQGTDSVKNRSVTADAGGDKYAGGKKKTRQVE
jgi:hypothetical protein